MKKFLLLLLILSSCSATNLLKRADRLIKKAELKGATWSADTVYKEVIVHVPELKVDTVVAFTYDTITIVKDNIITKVKIDERTKKIYITTEQEAKKVYVRVPYTVTRTIKAGYTGWQVIGGSLFAFVVGAILSKIFWRSTRSHSISA